jgi:hypothetical protein
MQLPLVFEAQSGQERGTPDRFGIRLLAMRHRRQDGKLGRALGGGDVVDDGTADGPTTSGEKAPPGPSSIGSRHHAATDSLGAITRTHVAHSSRPRSPTA